MRGTRPAEAALAEAEVAPVPVCAARRAGAAPNHASVVAIAAVTMECFIVECFIVETLFSYFAPGPSWGPNIPYTCPSAVVSSLNIPLGWEASLARKPLMVTSAPALMMSGL